jgi:transcription initiation factor TFIIIB Brf1 subunit/transcription initiation factor TFIIB
MCDCGAPDLVTDSGCGDVVCRQCGVVVEAHIFDERLESYGDEAGPRAGPARDAWLLPCQSVVLDGGVARRRRAQADPHASTRELFAVVDWLGRTFSGDVRDTAKLLCRDLAAVRTVRSDARHLHAAAALYLATKMHGRGIGRSKREIAALFGGVGVTERGLTVTAKLFRDQLAGSSYARQLFSGLDADDLINRCVDRLALDADARRAVKKAAHALAARVPALEVEGKTPGSVCSGVVACALQQAGVKLSKKHVLECCRVSGATMDKMTKAVAQWTAA